MVTFKGKQVTLVGRKLKTSTFAPNFKVVSKDLKEVGLSNYKNKIKVITTFLSLDTPVCDLQVKEFNKKASEFDVEMLGISKDLPFAQSRFCESFNIKNMTLLSDYKSSSFGINYGLLVKELNLLARAVIIIDKSDVVRYVQIVDELTKAPDYEKVLSSIKEVIKNPASKEAKEANRCLPCEGGVKKLSKEKIDQLMAQAKDWELVEDRKIVREFKFKDFLETKYFLDLVALLSEEEGHHPSFTMTFNTLKISLTTHASGGLTDNDFIMAKMISEMYGKS